MHGEGDGRRQVELSDLLPDITRDKLDGSVPVSCGEFGSRKIGYKGLVSPPV
jgi:hypothetical protein